MAQIIAKNAKTFLFLLLLAASQCSYGQLSFSVENISSFYHAGEGIDYEIITGDSAPFRIILTDGKGNYANQILIEILTDGMASGTYFLPGDIPSGIYYLVTQSLIQPSLAESIKLHIVNLSTIDPKAEINGDTSPRNVIVPTYERLALTGVLRDLQGQPIPNQQVVLQYRSNTQLMESTRTDRQGNFIFNSKVTGETEAFISPISISKEYTISVNDCLYLKPNSSESLSPEPLTFPGSQLELVKSKIISANFEESFKNSRDINQVSFLQYRKTYSPKDFVGLMDTYTFIKNAVALKVLRNRKNGIHFRLINTETSQAFENEPTILIDGFISDKEKLFAMPLDQIESVSTTNSSKRNYNLIGRLANDGVVSVKTKAGNYVPKNGAYLTLSGFSN